MSDHMKRLAVPRSWPVKKKSHVWITKQSAGAHSIEESMPAVVVLRDILGICDNAKEAKRAIADREILVDGKALKDYKAPIGLMDVVSIPKMKQNYRMLLNNKGKLTLVSIPDENAKWKLCLIENKTVIAGGKIQLNFHDGRNIVLDKNDYKTGDVLKVSFDGQKILDHYPLKDGAVALIIKGHHAGHINYVSEYVAVKGPAQNVVKFADGTETVKGNVFIIGASKAAIMLPEVEN